VLHAETGGDVALRIPDLPVVPGLREGGTVKIQHKVNHGWVPRSGSVDDAYEAEVQQATRRGEARWLKAVKAVERAERAVQRIERKRTQTMQVRTELHRARQAPQAWRAPSAASCS